MEQINDLMRSLDTVWVLIASMLIFLMQAGFALLEAGLSRQKNTANVLMKNVLDFAVGTLIFWFIGFGLMFGEGSFIGKIDLFGMADWSGSIPNYAFLIFQTMFCATTVSIISGAVTERTKFSAYLVYSIIIFAFVYPISGHWAWGEGGWLLNLGFQDFAGSAVIHTIGGSLALVGAWIVGPRTGKYRKKKDGSTKVYAIPGHNMTAASLGVFILWFGWFGFNPGSQLGAAGETARNAISHVFFTTNISASTGGVVALIVCWIKYGKPTLSLCLNGVLAGLVGVTAGCNEVDPFGAAIIGAVCSIAMIYSVQFIDQKLKVDDPVGAISVHCVSGVLGTLLLGLLSPIKGLLYTGDASFFSVQALGIASYIAWGLGTGFVIFTIVNKVIGMRVDTRVEEEGLDIYEHGEAAYNH